MYQQTSWYYTHWYASNDNILDPGFIVEVRRACVVLSRVGVWLLADVNGEMHHSFLFHATRSLADLPQTLQEGFEHQPIWYADDTITPCLPDFVSSGCTWLVGNVSWLDT